MIDVLLAMTFGEKIMVALVGSGFLGTALWKTIGRVRGFFKRVDNIDDRVEDLEESVYGSDKDDLNQGTIDEIQETRKQMDSIKDKLDKFLKK